MYRVLNSLLNASISAYLLRERVIDNIYIIKPDRLFFSNYCKAIVSLLFLILQKYKNQLSPLLESLQSAPSKVLRCNCCECCDDFSLAS